MQVCGARLRRRRAGRCIASPLKAVTLAMSKSPHWSPYAEGMPEALQIVCPHCDMINRISRSAPRWGAAELQGACGFWSGQSACERPVAPRRALDRSARRRILELPRLLALLSASARQAVAAVAQFGVGEIERHARIVAPPAARGACSTGEPLETGYLGGPLFGAAATGARARARGRRPAMREAASRLPGCEGPASLGAAAARRPAR